MSNDKATEVMELAMKIGAILAETPEEEQGELISIFGHGGFSSIDWGKKHFIRYDNGFWRDISMLGREIENRMVIDAEWLEDDRTEEEIEKDENDYYAHADEECDRRRAEEDF